MPTFVFTSPDGKKHTVKGPEGSTPAEAFQVLQQSMGGSGRMPQAPGGADPNVERERQRTADKELYDPTAGMSWGEKALTNVGAGMDSAVQGVSQLFGGGPSDEELQEKRRIDEHLASQTAGGGALQLAGEVAPSIPLGLGAGAAAARGPALVRALAASPTLSAAGGGAMSGAMMPTTSDESKLANVAMGAAGGATAGYAVPRLIKAGKAAGRVAGNVGERVVAGLGDAPGMAGFAGRAAERQGTKGAGKLLTKSLPGGVGQDVYTRHPHITDGPGPSAAVSTQDPRLASLELGSRSVAGDEWQAFDKATKEARWKALDEGLMGPDDLASKIDDANKVGAEIAELYPKIPKGPFFKSMDQFYNDLQTAKNTAQYHGNPAVKAAVDYVEGAMEKAEVVTPELLHLIRRTVSKGLTGVPGAGEAGVRAASSEPFVISLVKAMDDVLNKASKGKFDAWKGTYAEKMTKAESAKADINVRSKFVDPATGTPLKPVTGTDDIPEVTGHALKQALKSAGSVQRGPKKGTPLLSTGSEDLLQGVRKDLDAQAILQRNKASSTGGSGSDTASNLSKVASVLALESMVPGAGVGRALFQEGGMQGQQAMQRQLAALLQDPVALRRFIAAQEQQRLLRGRLAEVPLLGQVGAGAMLGVAGQ